MGLGSVGWVVVMLGLGSVGELVMAVFLKGGWGWMRLGSNLVDDDDDAVVVVVVVEKSFNFVR